ncbi:zinc-dependent alcohol dehydrogenase family protein [Spirillospora sp. NPDC049652]
MSAPGGPPAAPATGGLMRAIRFDRPGSPADVLSLREVPVPVPPPGHVRVRVTARPVNPSDLLFVEGRYGRRPEPPSGVGFEGAGVVDECGPDVALAPGTRVAVDAPGTWQDYVVVPRTDLVPLPDDVGDEAGCRLTVNPATAVLLVRELALEPGQWLVQTGGASAVARMVTRLMRARGVRCVSVVRDAGRREDLAALGAEVVAGSPGHVAERVRRLTGGRGAAAVLDSVGGAAGSGAVRCLADGGRLLVYGMMSGEPLTVDPDDLVFRSIDVRGFWLPERLGRLGERARADLTATVLDGVRSGELAAPVEARYGLADFASALRHAARRGRTGTVLLVG